MDDPSDDLVAQAQAGSEPALAGLVRLHQAQVRAYLGRFLHSDQVVEDLAQETFLTAFLKLDAYRSEAPFRVWLLKIARTEALMYLRQEARRRSHKGRLAATLSGFLADRLEAEPDRPEEREKELRALADCVGRLPEKSATLVKDYYVDGRTAPEIARRTGRTENAIWVALLRIRQILKECVQLKTGEAGASS